MFQHVFLAAEQLNIVDLIKDSTGAVMAVLVILVAMSLVSWYIIAMKAAYLSKARRQSDKFQEVFGIPSASITPIKKPNSSCEAPSRKCSAPAMSSLQSSKKAKKNAIKTPKRWNFRASKNVERALRRASLAETTELEKNLSFLATTGSTAPFIGLFGTVWGIMHAFVNLSASTSDMGIQTVSGPIAEALIATAIGLLAAIPSVMAYNFFNQKIKVLQADMESFSNDFLNIVKRHFFK